jgi:hypothetical protein
MDGVEVVVNFGGEAALKIDGGLVKNDTECNNICLKATLYEYQFQFFQIVPPQLN